MRVYVLTLVLTALTVALETTPGSTTVYQYDSLHRLTQITYDDGSVILYEYDAVGNRTRRLIGGDCNHNGIPDPGDLLPTEHVIRFTFDTSPGWTTQGQWAFGKPTGGGSYNHDPTTGRSGSNVYGYNLAGDYTNNMPAYYLTTTPINCAGLTGLELRFWRWLGIESATADHASVEVSDDGATWTTVWEHTEATIADTSWTQVVLDLPEWLDNQQAVYIRWAMGPTNATITYPGWNIDDVEIRGWRPATSADCNGNGLPDKCDIAAGTSLDVNLNGVPDECELWPPPGETQADEQAVSMPE